MSNSVSRGRVSLRTRGLAKSEPFGTHGWFAFSLKQKEIIEHFCLLVGKDTKEIAFIYDCHMKKFIFVAAIMLLASTVEAGTNERGSETRISTSRATMAATRGIRTHLYDKQGNYEGKKVTGATRLSFTTNTGNGKARQSVADCNQGQVDWHEFELRNVCHGKESGPRIVRKVEARGAFARL